MEYVDALSEDLHIIACSDAEWIWLLDALSKSMYKDTVGYRALGLLPKDLCWLVDVDAKYLECMTIGKAVSESKSNDGDEISESIKSVSLKLEEANGVVVICAGQKIYISTLMDVHDVRRMEEA